MAEAAELGSMATAARAMFLMLTPNESSFERVEDVPPYVLQVGIASLALTSMKCVVFWWECQTGPLPAPLHFRATRFTVAQEMKSQTSRWTADYYA